MYFSQHFNYNIATTPLYFVRSGYININVGRLRNAGVNGYDWSALASSRLNNGSATPSAYDLRFIAAGVYPSDGPTDRWYGFPLRCPGNNPRLAKIGLSFL